MPEPRPLIGPPYNYLIFFGLFSGVMPLIIHAVASMTGGEGQAAEPMLIAWAIMFSTILFGGFAALGEAFSRLSGRVITIDRSAWRTALLLLLSGAVQLAGTVLVTREGPLAVFERPVWDELLGIMARHAGAVPT